MHPDPHELGQRRPAYAKDPRLEAMLDGVNRALEHARLPPAGPGAERAAERPLIYVVGAPRSGTTLLHQLICRHLPVGYIDNLAARFWSRPSVGIALSLTMLGRPEGRCLELSSRHGVTPGPAGPSEYGYFWRHWLAVDASPTHHLDPSAQASVDAPGLRRTLEQEVLTAFDAPVVFKNLICGLNAALLARVHRRSVFVQVGRSPVDVVRSILRVRLERYGSYDTWWSLKPSTYPFSDLRGDPVGEVVRQVRDCQAEVQAEVRASGAPALAVEYEELCAAPARVLQAIAERLGDLGHPVRVREAPPVLTPRGAPPLPQHLDSEVWERCAGTSS